MKALVCNGPHDVRIADVPDARIEQPFDVLVKITATHICGSDLHMDEGRTDFEEGRILGHENVGEVIAVGAGIAKTAVADMVSVPFNVSCGHCQNCEHGLISYCLAANVEGMVGGAYGFADMGGWIGGQAEYLRVPWGDFQCLRLPEDARDKRSIT
ncbi:alcohol dehydrogenase catalytic domain-containing protein [Nocardiopsis oceani]